MILAICFDRRTKTSFSLKFHYRNEIFIRLPKVELSDSVKSRAEKFLLNSFFQKELLKVSKRSQRNEKGVKKNLSALLNQITNRSMRFVSHQ